MTRGPILVAAAAALNLTALAAPSHAEPIGTISAVEDNVQTIEQFRAKWNNLLDRAKGRSDIQHFCEDGLCVWNWELRPHVWAKMVESNNGTGQAWYCFLSEPATTWDCYGNTLQKWVWNPTGDTTVASAGPGSVTTIVHGGASDPVTPGLYTPPPAAGATNDARSDPDNICNQPGYSCSPKSDTPPATSQPVVSANAVPIVYLNNAAYVYATLGAVTIVPMQIDTGCSSMTVSRDYASQLLARGEATVAPAATVSMADGHTASIDQIIIATVKVGTHVAYNVKSGVIEDPKANMLLGMGVLGQLGKFSIDTANSQLVFG